VWGGLEGVGMRKDWNGEREELEGVARGLRPGLSPLRVFVKIIEIFSH
jgi:hypothetical protein